MIKRFAFTLLIGILLAACSSGAAQTGRQSGTRTYSANSVNTAQSDLQPLNTPLAEESTSTPPATATPGETQAPSRTVSIQIPVSVTAFPFSVYTADLSVDQPIYVGSCADPVLLNFNGSITANGPGTVTYHFKRSDGVVSKTQTIVFNEAGTQPVATNWAVVGTPHLKISGWEQIVIDTPTSQELAKTNFTLVCNAY